ncbi:GNAT family N-acetyltransferase [Kutzneria sp. NPDC051319]|uniref:GNAT family N-acetyltransferase n=1 Tax=Kutzneria sp. NPDC051319 TaxID=3155047 RepID=UPI00341A7006
MQFLPTTFVQYSPPIPAGGVTPATPYDPADAIYAAASMLCANGARGGRDVHAAVFSYNHLPRVAASAVEGITHISRALHRRRFHDRRARRRPTREIRTANLGYRVARQVAGRGVATKSVRELCRIAATRHGLRALRAATSHDDAASHKGNTGSSRQSSSPTSGARWRAVGNLGLRHADRA